MINLRDYIKSTLQLVNSMTIYIQDEAYFIEDTIFKLTGNRELDPLKWKYVLNLQGKPHPLIDVPIYTYIPDIGKVDIITVDNINSYPVLKQELLRFDDTFHRLISNYPRQATQIRGILNPIDEKTVIEAKDGEILYYNKNFISENETDLIYEIQTFVYNFLSRYHIKAYMVDEYYLPAMISLLYSVLPGFVLAKRLGNILSNKTDAFHIENWLYTLKELDPGNLLNMSTKIWLYGNLNDIRTNVGHNRILGYLVEKILEENNVGVGNLTINKTAPVLKDDIGDLKDLPYSKDHILDIKPVNKAYIKEDDDEIDVLKTLEIEKTLDLIPDDINIYRLKDIYEKQINSIKLNEANTKVFFLDKKEMGNFYPETILTILVYNFIYKLKNKEIYVDSKYVDPIAKKLIEIDTNKAFYIFIKYLLSISGINDEEIWLTEYTFDYVYKPITDTTELTKDLMYGTELKPFADIMVHTLNEYSNTVNLQVFHKYILVLLKTMSFMWYLISNVNDQMLSADLKVLFNRMFKKGRIREPRPVELNSLIESYGLRTEFPKDLAYNGLRSIVKTFFNLDIREIDVIVDTLKSYLKLSNKFKSYTIQFVFDANVIEKQNIQFNSVMLGSANKGIVTVQYGHFRYYIDSRIWHRYIQLPPETVAVAVNPDYYIIKPTEKLKLSSKMKDIIVLDSYSTIHRGELFDMLKPAMNGTMSDGKITLGNISMLDEAVVKNPSIRYNVKSIQTSMDEFVETNAIYPNYQTKGLSSIGREEYFRTENVDSVNEVSTEKRPISRSTANDISVNEVTTSRELNTSRYSPITSSKTEEDGLNTNEIKDKTKASAYTTTVIAEENRIVTVPTNTTYTVDPE